MKRNECKNILKFIMATVCLASFMFLAMCDLDSSNGYIGDLCDRAKKSIS